MLDACLAFNGWLRESCRVPDYWSECNGDAGNTPLFQSVKLTLRTEFQCTEEEALRTPVSLALADCFALWDARGNLELITDEDAECMRLARRMHAERMAGENGASRN